ncbi:hypothetical protein CCUS01_06058 [Colletotrichum cuscutae]|uniref:MADS-box domain-containing protein n=1 Tax=Colletotrichum cuscutae TaxID=1209917 RepID=A0AAI9Y546_9PEZI|nr:hypothetical protein CCUS01_06058 [Colletotrichum cuscutae]
MDQSAPKSVVTSFVPEAERLRKDSKRRGTLFSHRKKALFRKADRIFQDCDAKVYTFIERKGRIWIYTSHPSDDTLPRSQASLVRSPSSPCPAECTNVLKRQQYPLPVLCTPSKPDSKNQERYKDEY